MRDYLRSRCRFRDNCSGTAHARVQLAAVTLGLSRLGSFSVTILILGIPHITVLVIFLVTLTSSPDLTVAY